MFKEVKLYRGMGCVEYALKRIGNYSKFRSYEDVLAGKNTVIIPYNKNVVNVGDIVIWDKDMREKDEPFLLTKEGVFVTRRRLAGYHFGVVERDMLVSDLILDAPDYVRFSPLDDFKPTKILRFV